MSARGDFYEEDEPIEHLLAAFDRGAKGVTVVPPAPLTPQAHGSYYTLTTISSAGRTAIDPYEHLSFVRQPYAIPAP